MNDRNPPTARQGIRASQAGEHAIAQAAEPKAQVASNPAVASSMQEERANAQGFLNTESARVEEKWPDTAPREDQFSVDFLVVDDEKRNEFLREALAAYRATLVGLRVRTLHELESGYAGSLNPGGQKLVGLDNLRAIRNGIAKCNLLMSELGDNQVQPRA